MYIPESSLYSARALCAPLSLPLPSAFSPCAPLASAGESAQNDFCCCVISFWRREAGGRTCQKIKKLRSCLRTVPEDIGQGGGVAGPADLTSDSFDSRRQWPWRQRQRGTLHLETKSIEFLRAVRNQIHTRDPQNARNPILESVWCHMATPNFTLINSLCCCFDLIFLLKFVGFTKVLHFWGNIKMIIRKQSKLAQHPTNFLAPTNHNKS